MATNKGFCGLILLFLVILYAHAYAYIDPASGSYFLQLLLAGLLGALFALKIFWRNVKGFILGIFSKKRKAKTHGRRR